MEMADAAGATLAASSAAVAAATPSDVFFNLILRIVGECAREHTIANLARTFGYVESDL